MLRFKMSLFQVYEFLLHDKTLMVRAGVKGTGVNGLSIDIHTKVINLMQTMWSFHSKLRLEVIE